MIKANALYFIDEELDEEFVFQEGAIWIDGFTSNNIQAQVMHYNKEKGLVFCLQKKNFGCDDISPDAYDIDDFIENFAFMGVKK